LAPPGTGSVGSSTTVGQDSSLLIASTDIATGTNPYAGRKGLLLRTTSTTGTNSSPSVTWQGYNSTRLFWRSYINNVSKSLNFDYSTDTTTWTNGIIIGNTGALSAGGYVLTGASSNFTATKFYLDTRGYGWFGGNARGSNGVAWQFSPNGSTFYGLGLPQLSTANRTNYPSTLVTGSIISGGSAYTNGTYLAKAFTNVSGSGSGGLATFIVSGNSITSVTVTTAGTGGYKVGDTLSVLAANVGGTGSGFTYLVTGIYGDSYNGNVYYDSSASKVIYFNKTAHLNDPLVDSIAASGNLTVSSAGTLTLVAGNDYIFSGITSTYTLPAISTTAIGRFNRICIKNRGSGSITLNAASGSTIYNTAAQSTITIIAGAACELLPDGTYFNVMYNN